MEQDRHEARSPELCCHEKGTSIAYGECVCRLSYPARNAREPYCIVICGLYASAIFSPLYLINGMITERDNVYNKCVQWGMLERT